jgi:Flp pilus assembly protein TadB
VNPGPTLGLTAVIAAYIVVLGALLIFMAVMSRKRKRLERRRKELKQ